MRTVTLAAVCAALAAGKAAMAQTPPMAGMTMPEAATAPAGTMPGMSGPPMAMPAMAAALGPYGMSREASGTSWQPDASPMTGAMLTAGDWSVMVHALLDGVQDSQGGPRGGDKAFFSGMVMAMAARDVGDRGRLQLRAMLSPDPLMGADGYPLLLATGETANGVTPLIDRQHPHDLFMELSGSYSYRLGGAASAFLYAGLPGEPAFGPPAFMHRLSILDSPEAPISHHWVDSMHISEGVVTGGLVWGPVKLEASGFRGREPDQHRYDIETPRLDSLALRASVNPTRRLALQVSWARQVSPEELDPAVNERRWSASAIYTAPIGREGFWSTTAIWARRQAVVAGAPDGPALDAWVLESAVHPDDRWTIYGRAERVDNNELLASPLGYRAPGLEVGKIELGAIRDFRLGPHVTIGLGAQAARNFVGAALSAAYGGDPWGAMAFARLKVD